MCDYGQACAWPCSLPLLSRVVVCLCLRKDSVGNLKIAVRSSPFRPPHDGHVHRRQSKLIFNRVLGNDQVPSYSHPSVEESARLG